MLQDIKMVTQMYGREKYGGKMNLEKNLGCEPIKKSKSLVKLGSRDNR